MLNIDYSGFRPIAVLPRVIMAGDMELEFYRLFNTAASLSWP